MELWLERSALSYTDGRFAPAGQKHRSTLFNPRAPPKVSRCLYRRTCPALPMKPKETQAGYNTAVDSESRDNYDPRARGLRSKFASRLHPHCQLFLIGDRMSTLMPSHRGLAQRY